MKEEEEENKEKRNLKLEKKKKEFEVENRVKYRCSELTSSKRERMRRKK
jgi:hypothetical protein